MSGSERHAVLSVLHLRGGGCGGCGLEVEALLASGRLDPARLRQVDSPRHADVLLVSGSVGRSLMQAATATWAAMAEPKWLVTVGACAQDGGPFRGTYAVEGGIAGRLPVTLPIPGCPPSPDAIADGLLLLLDAIRASADGDPPTAPPDGPGSVAEPVEEAIPAPGRDLPALLPAAPRHRLAGDDSSAG